MAAVSCNRRRDVSVDGKIIVDVSSKQICIVTL